VAEGLEFGDQPAGFLHCQLSGLGNLTGSNAIGSELRLAFVHSE
jgi:hypothetical protein